MYSFLIYFQNIFSALLESFIEETEETRRMKFWKNKKLLEKKKPEKMVDFSARIRLFRKS